MKRKPIFAVMGTDGSGKTTILNAIVPELERTLGGRIVVHHLKPDFLPPLGRFRGVRHEAGYVCTDPHGSKPSGFLGSLFRIAYLHVDYVLGYWLKVRRTLRREDVGAWVFDRYAYDMLIDPRRFRIALPPGIIRFFLAFAPKPDRIVCLGGAPEKIFARKPETSLDEVRRQVRVLKAFCEANPNAVWVDTTVSLSESVAAAKRAICK